MAGVPRIRRDLIKRHLYLVPNSIVVSRGCPHVCDFCYKEAFFRGGKSFYTQAVDDALAEIERLPGRHLYFLDDHLFGNPRFAEALFDGMRGMGRLWQAAGTVKSILQPGLLEKAVASGLRSLFVGFETLNPANLREQHKYQNLNRDYNAAIRRLHELGVMVNGSFVFGMDGDDETVFDRTVEWAVAQGIETATFHILTPYPSTALYQRMAAQGRLLHSRWDLYDTRHVVYQPANISPAALEEGYWRAYRDFYRWGSIFKGAWAKDGWPERLRHVAYAGGWKKLEPLWDGIIRAKRATRMLPVLETVLSGFGTHAPRSVNPVRYISHSSYCGTPEKALELRNTTVRNHWRTRGTIMGFRLQIRRIHRFLVRHAFYALALSSALAVGILAGRCCARSRDHISSWSGTCFWPGCPTAGACGPQRSSGATRTIGGGCCFPARCGCCSSRMRRISSPISCICTSDRPCRYGTILGCWRRLRGAAAFWRWCRCKQCSGWCGSSAARWSAGCLWALASA